MPARRSRNDAIFRAADVLARSAPLRAHVTRALPLTFAFCGVTPAAGFRFEGWVEQATKRALARGLGGRFSYQQGEAQRLPFPDNAFDLTTCQTVLIHLPDPAAAISEMLRVTRPGGLVTVAEPNNLTESLLLDSISNLASIDDIVELVRYHGVIGGEFYLVSGRKPVKRRREEEPR